MMIETPYTTMNSGYELWLSYRLLQEPLRSQWAATAAYCVALGSSPILESVRSELKRALPALLGEVLHTEIESARLIVGTSDDLQKSSYALDKDTLGCVPESGEGWLIHRDPDNRLYVVSHGERGVLYGVFALLRLMQTGTPVPEKNITDSPALNLRGLNHWDNPDGSIERG